MIPCLLKKTAFFVKASIGQRESARDMEVGREAFDPSVGKIPWRRKWQTTSVFLPGKSDGQRSLMDYSPLGSKESDMTEHSHTLSNLS